MEFSRRRRGGRGGGGFVGPDMWDSDGIIGTSTAAGDVAILELGEILVDAVDAALGDKFPLGRVTPVKSYSNLYYQSKDYNNVHYNRPL